jgi:ATP-dependent exoDNAse (exonuclease V) beta subunit
MLYVAMTRGRHHEAFIYQRFNHEADHEHAKPVAGDAIHQLQLGNKYSAAHYVRRILINDDRPRTMHAEAERTERALLPEGLADLISTPR